MPPPEPSARALLDALAALPLEVEFARATCASASVPSYPGGIRPSALVECGGAGACGVGEHVAWTVAEHERLGAALPALAPLGRWRLGAWAAEVARRTAAPHARAALEAAAIDLALRQRGTSLFALAGAPPRPVRYVVSFGRSADPAAEARRLAGAADHVEWKIDADPRWDDAVYHALADLGSVAVLDFKGAGSAADHARAHHALPEALLEDPDPAAAPWTASLRARLGADAPVVSAAAVATLPVRPAAVNVKPARMGGVLEALACLAVCAEAGIAAYLGGMWEVGPGRRQLQALAALLAPDGPNDVAPLATTTAPAARPARLAVDATAPGFGAERR